MLVWIVSGASTHSVGEFYICCRGFGLIRILFSFRELRSHVTDIHKWHLRLNCQVVIPNHGMCSWSCGSYMLCMTAHLRDYHGVDDPGHGEFPKTLVFMTSTREPLQKGVSFNLSFDLNSCDLFQSHSALCVHYKEHQKTLKADLTKEERGAVDAGFIAKVAELVVARSKRDNNVEVKEGLADPADSESLGGDDTFSAGEGGGEEEEEEGSDGGDDDEGSGEDDDEDSGSDAESGADPEVGENELPRSSDRRMILYIRKARDPVYKTDEPPLELDDQGSRDDEAFRRGRSKCDNTNRDSNGSESDMDLDGLSEGNEAPFAGPPAEEEMLMKEQSDQQVMAVEDVMLPAHVGSKPGGNRYFFI